LGSENKVGESKNWMPPEHHLKKFTNKHVKEFKNEETKNLWKPVLFSKVVNPFTRALGSPFIGRRRDFYIQDCPRI
jgi:hypothetical protein